MNLTNWRSPDADAGTGSAIGLADIIRMTRSDIQRLEQAVARGDTVLIRRGAQLLEQTAREYGMVDAMRFAHGVKRGASDCCLANTLEQLENLKACFEDLERRVF